MDLRVFWGKAGFQASADVVPHPLICHAIDTAVVADLLFDVLVGPPLRAQLAIAFAPVGEARSWVALLAGLHDLGKCSPAFQALRADVAARYLPDAALADVNWVHAHNPDRGRTDTFHGALTALHVRRMFTAWGASPHTALTLALALGGHHGFFDAAETLRQAADAANHHGGPTWAGWAEDLVRELAGLLGLEDPASGDWSQVELGLPVAVALAGLTTVSDWIASHSVSGRQHAGVNLDLSAYLALSRRRAVDLIATLNWAPWRPPADTSFVSLHGDEPRPLQDIAEQFVGGRTRPGILVVEAPTGEGKTKLALQCAAMLVGQLGLAGFYVAMPTRATSNQAFTEVKQMLVRLDERLPVKLLHGTAAEYLAEERRSLEAARAEVIRPEDIGLDAPGGSQDDEAREWFTRKKGLLAPLSVGTVDRLLQAVIRSRFAPVPLAGLSSKVVIVDEVHGYDTYMSTLLDRLLWWLGRLGVPVVLLSATLPSDRRTDLVRAWCAGARGYRPEQVTATSTPTGYPSLMWADQDSVEPETAPASNLNSERTVRLGRVANHELVDWLLARVRPGGCAVAIHNLVARADATYRALADAVARLPENDRPDLVLITGQLSNARRAAAEAALRAKFGPKGDRPARAIVVGTQVLEQSLDLDFDVMVSDLAPIDSLIQRAGRLHRFRKVTSPPLFAITGVDDTPKGPSLPPHVTRVYQEIVLLRTWALLRDRTELRLPDEVPALVDAVYGAVDAVDCPAGWQRRWSDAGAKLERAREAHRRQAVNLYLPQPTDRQGLRALTVQPKNPTLTRRPDGRGTRRG